MRQRLLAPFFVIALAASGSGAIDFRAMPEDYVSEGIAYRQLGFKDGEKSITIELPSKWTYRSSEDRLQLLAPPPTSAEGTLQDIALPAPQPLDDAAKNTFVQQALTSVPPGSEQAAVVEQKENPVLIEGHESFGVTISYQAFGESFQRNIILVNFPEHRLLLRFTAPKAQFESLNAAFRRAVTSWQPGKSAPKP